MRIEQRSYTGLPDQTLIMALARKMADDHLHVTDLPYRLSCWALDNPANARLVREALDLLVPAAVSWTIDGNSPVTLGGNEGSGTYSAGVAADVDGRWRVDVKYVDFFGYTADNGTMVTRANGLLALLENRGHVVLTAKATF